MAEAFARAYGADVLSVASAGLAPAFAIPDMTLKVMAGKNITLSAQFPKELDGLGGSNFDLIVNLSGRKLPAGFSGVVEEWPVEDPIGGDEAKYCEVRDQIERLVMRLVLNSRNEAKTWAPPREGPVVEPPRREGSVVEPPRRRKFLR